MKTRMICSQLLLIGSAVSIAAQAALSDPALEMTGLADRVVLVNRWPSSLLQVLLGCAIYMAFICLLGRAVGINKLDQDA